MTWCITNNDYRANVTMIRVTVSITVVNTGYNVYPPTMNTTTNGIMLRIKTPRYRITIHYHTAIIPDATEYAMPRNVHYHMYGVIVNAVYDGTCFGFRCEPSYGFDVVRQCACDVRCCAYRVHGCAYHHIMTIALR